MKPIQATLNINAPLQQVFQTVADIRYFTEAVPHIIRCEILSDTQSGAGTRFRETRLMKGREASTELEITEYEENERVRIVADSYGTVWDTVFTVNTENGATRLHMEMDAKAYKLLPKLMNPLMRGMVAKAVIQDMEAVKTYCEEKSKQAN